MKKDRVNISRVLRLGLAALILLCTSSVSFAAGVCEPTGARGSDGVLVPPDYFTFQPPAVGGWYCDGTFGTMVKRLTGSQNGYVTNSEIAYFNVDDSYFIATDGNITYLYDGQDGHRIKEIGGAGLRPWWIRWARGSYYTAGGVKRAIDPAKHFYKYEGNEVQLYNLETLSYVVLHRFEEYSEIGPAGGEGDVSQDGRYWVLDGKRKADGQLELFAYDLLDDRKGPVSPFEVGSVGGKGYGADFAAISPSGKYIVIAWDAGLTDPYNGYYGVEVFERETWKFVSRAHPSRVHIELGFDAFGEEVVFTGAGNSSAEIATFGVSGLALGDQISVRMRDGFARKLLDVPRWAHFVLSYSPGLPGYIFVGYDKKSEDPAQLWGPYWGEIFAVKTDGSGQAVRLVHHRSWKVGNQSSKEYQPDFFMNNKGNKIVFNSTFGLGRADLYFFDTGLPGSVGPPAPAPSPNQVPVAHGGSISTVEGQAVSGQLSASDADGDLLTYGIVTQSSLGKTALTDGKKGTYTYMPDPGANGTDSFTFMVNDRKADSNVATVVVKIEPAALPAPVPPPAPSPAAVSLPPADYSTFKPPAAQQAYADPVFGTVVKRLTDSGQADLSTSEISYFSIDDSSFLARENNATRLFDGKDGRMVRALENRTIQPWSLRFARGNYYISGQEKKIFNPAKHFYHIEGNEIRLYNLETLDSTVLYKFPEYSKIGPAGGRGDLSQNGRYWAVVGTKPDGKQDLFVYDLFKSLKGKVCPFDPGVVGSGRYAGVHFATVSPSWKYVVVAWNTGSSRSFNGHHGVEVFDPFTWTLIRRIHPTWAQFELGWDGLGKEVFFAAAGNTPEELASFRIPGISLGDLVAVELETGIGRKLLSFSSRAPFSLAYASGQPGYVFVSVEAQSDSPDQLWAPYWGEILAVATDGSGRVVRLVHHRSRKAEKFSYSPNFLVNNKGTKIVFRSTFGVGGPDFYIFDVNLR